MYEYKVKDIIKIYDADTITITADLGFNISVTETFRLWGINAPEMKGDSKDAGTISRDWLRNVMYTALETNKDIIIKTKRDEKEKYGRWLAEVFIDGININEQLVAEGLAVEFMRK